MEEKNLPKLKSEYSVLKEKYSLPEFDDLNKNFQIEKISDEETDFLLREIRKIIVEKFLDYLRLVESLINPSNSPMFVFALAKTLGTTEREKLVEIYKKITKTEIEFIERDLDYSEEKEAESIKNHSVLWEEIKKEMLEVVSVIKKNIDNKTENNGKNYFG